MLMQEERESKIFYLTKLFTNQDVWRPVKEFIIISIDELRSRLENSDDYDEMKLLQGQIRAFKSFLMLEKEFEKLYSAQKTKFSS